MSESNPSIVSGEIRGYQFSTKIGKCEVISEVKFIKIDGRLKIRVDMRMSQSGRTWVSVFEGESSSPNLTDELMKKEATNIVCIYSGIALPKLLAQQELDKMSNFVKLAKVIKTEGQFREEIAFDELKAISEINYRGHINYEDLGV